ncbi:hypothetical protein LXA43DRAFT_1100996 [Ganoderma leucocontextum]|nr:hypothetical protein LXA43DRAFT_1100996 [Ganoderma leucocontextum]
MFSCLGCPKTFSSTKALRTHAASCTKKVGHGGGTTLTETLRKRLAEESAERRVKRQKQVDEAAEREREEAEAALAAEPVPPPSPPPLPEPTAGRRRKAPGRYKDFLPTTVAGLPAHLKAAHPRVATPQAPRRIIAPIPQPALVDPPAFPTAESPPHIQTPPSKPSTIYCTQPDAFGLYRVFPIKPKRDPDDTRTLASVCDPCAFPDVAASMIDPAHGPSGLEATIQASMDSAPDPWAPFPNISTFDMLYWQNNESNLKSHAQMNLLAKCMQEPGFCAEDLAKFDSAREVARLDSYVEDVKFSPLSTRDGWIKTSVKLHVPKEGVRYASETEAPEFKVEDVFVRSLREVIAGALRHPNFRNWRTIPHKLLWRPPGSTSSSSVSSSISTSTSSSRMSSPTPTSSSSSSHDTQSCSSSSSGTPSSADAHEGIRVYSEVYNSDAMLEADARLREQPREVGDPDDLEYFVIAIILWSDSTHLTSFGSASLWPIYLYFANQSKYVRARPSSFSAHHLAYVPSLPDRIQDFYMEEFGTAATGAVLTFLRRELMQAILLLLLDEAFMYIFVHGCDEICGDGVHRRGFPRFFFHGADYPEKILLACLRYFARCPCPRCRINKDKLLEMGTRNDTFRRNQHRVDNDDVKWRIDLTRRWIYQDGMALTSVYVDRVLGPLSLTPTRNAFSTRFREHGLNFYSMFVPDLMHEFELGVWKSTFTHLLRILYAAGEDKIQIFNQRFRSIPTFSRSTIRRFSANVSEQGKLAARDYEARVKCFIAPFENLLPRGDNNIVLDMVFDLAKWHALGKLRAQTSPTLDGLTATGIDVGKDVRLFSNKTCQRWVTLELPKESAARGLRKARTRTAGAPLHRKVKSYSMTTYKYHSLADYTSAIRDFGSTDNFNTQTSELEHRHVKRFYARTNKNQFAFQIALHTRRQEKLQIIKQRVDAWRVKQKSRANALDSEPDVREAEVVEVLPYSSPDARYHIAKSQRRYDSIPAWISSHHGDPMLMNFYTHLKDHLST